MYGRYGMDQLYYALLIVYAVLAVINIFISSPIISVLIWAVLVLALFRVFSRNGPKRRLENEKFLTIWNPAKAKFLFTVRRIREIKTRRYRKCPQCKAVLRLPRKTGKHVVECPGCHKDFKLNILW